LFYLTKIRGKFGQNGPSAVDHLFSDRFLVFHQGYFDGALVGWVEFANPNTMTAQFVGVPTVTPTYGTEPVKITLMEH
jgi:hypothetical protein